MRTNGFAIFRGPGASARAEGTLAKVDRCCLKVVTGPGGEFGAKEGKGGGEVCFVAYSLEEDGRLPLIHGFAEKPERLCEGQALGEFAFLTTSGGRIFAGRDSMGTRPLYSDEGRTCVATDHRFFDRAPVLLPRGTCLDTDSGEETVAPAASPAPSEATIEEAADRLSGLLDDSVARAG